MPARWPEDCGEVEKLYLKAEELVAGWDTLKEELKNTQTLADKQLLCAMMYQPCELCDATFTTWH